MFIFFVGRTNLEFVNSIFSNWNHFINIFFIQLAEKKDIDDEEPSQDDEDEDSFVVDYKNDEPPKLDEEDEKEEYLLWAFSFIIFF